MAKSAAVLKDSSEWLQKRAAPATLGNPQVVFKRGFCRLADGGGKDAEFEVSVAYRLSLALYSTVLDFLCSILLWRVWQVCLPWRCA